MSGKKKSNKMSRSIENLQITNTVPSDRPVIKLINELGHLVPGVKPKAAFKNFILRKLPDEIKAIRENGAQLTA